jgi:hypothetical protein
MEQELWKLERLRRYATELHSVIAEAETGRYQVVEAVSVHISANTSAGVL